jgi:two-component system nitrogen regulation response regulator NtrX
MRKGKFDQAHEGTIFLDEIGDMSLKAQSKTLRILQEQRFERVGGARTIKVDVRVIAATNKNLEAEIEKGTFREDLYYRLNVIPIHVPPLRDRLEDVPELIKEFITELALSTNTEPKEVSPEALSLLCRYDWPGNVRELRNLIERLLILTPGNVIEPAHIPQTLRKEPAQKLALDRVFVEDSLKDAKGEFEKAFIEAKLRQYNWNISQTAEAIGIERSNLHKKIKAYGLEEVKSE